MILYIFTICIILLLGLFAWFYRYITKDFDRFKKMGIPHDTPSFPFGTEGEMFKQMGKKHANEFLLAGYKKCDGAKISGSFMFGKAMFAINDPEMIRNVLVKDFNHFVDRNTSKMNKTFKDGGELDQMWLNQLTSLTGDEWKTVRSIFSPMFTSGKMKLMLRFIKKVAEDLNGEIEKIADTDEEFELKEMLGKFSMDSLASCAFGIDAQSFTNEDSMFVAMAKRMFETKTSDFILPLLKFIPGVNFILTRFNINISKPTATRFLRDAVMKTIEMRKTSGIRQNDLIDLMLDAMTEQNQEIVDDPDEEQFEKDSKLNFVARKNDIDIEKTMVGTAMIFLVAGYDTTGFTMSFLMHELANNPDIQDKLREEIDEAFDEADGKVPDYSVIQGLPYLDKVIHETLRLHPPSSLLLRAVTKPYTFPDTDINLKKNDSVTINVLGIQMDPKYYPDPETFNPDNFSKEAKASRSPYTFLAFGQGPRACIGMRFALLEAKVAIVMMLRKFTFVRGSKTPEVLISDPMHSFGYPKGGLWAKAVTRA